MPGHKGNGLLGCEGLDITEIKGADALYSADGIISESQQNAAELFGTGATFYSAEGSSLCIRAMLYLALLSRRNKSSRPVIAASRNSHKVLTFACALLDIDIIWLYPSDRKNVYTCALSGGDVSSDLKSFPDGLIAIYVTSPDYLGKMSDIASLADAAHRLGVPLIVDNAHGAYLKFSERAAHPIDLGADMCCDSAHKTLPVLTGGAYLHISKAACSLYAPHAMRALSIFASTSPSYLILSSLDLANKAISDGFKKKLAECEAHVADIKAKLASRGIEQISDEQLKITVAPKSFGYTGTALAELLRSTKIEPEFSDPDFVVLMFSPYNTKTDFKRLSGFINGLEKKPPILSEPPDFIICLRALSAREALFSSHESIPVYDSAGRILGYPDVTCPPAVPFVACGEIISESAVKAFEYYGTETVTVVK